MVQLWQLGVEVLKVIVLKKLKRMAWKNNLTVVEKAWWNVKEK